MTHPKTGLVAPVAFILVGCAGAPHPTEEREPSAVERPLAIPRRALEPQSDYRLGAQDLLTVRVFALERPGEVTTLELEVDLHGDIALPLAGSIAAAGKTVAELRAALEKALDGLLVSPQVNVAVKEYRSREVAVLGSVAKPGVIHLQRNGVTLLEALSVAGGLSKDAGTRVVILSPPGVGRGPLDVDLVGLTATGDPLADVPLEPGSVVEVPLAEDFYVMGFVNRPGAFPYHRPTTVLQAIALAGGLHERKASPSEVQILRRTASGVAMTRVDVEAIARGDAPDVPIFPGDTIQAGRTFVRAAITETLDALKGLASFGFSAGAF